MQRKLGIGAFPILALASSCSLVYDLSPDQCGKNSDCAQFGDYRCEEGLCVPNVPASGGSSGTDASGGTAGNDAGTSGTSGTTSGKGGMSGSGGKGGAGKGGSGAGTGGSSGEGGDAGDTGSGGTAGSSAGKGGSSGSGGTQPMPECESHDECFELNGETEPWACVDGECQALTTEDCPLVLPQYDFTYENLRSSDEAIIIGAFADLAQGANTPVIQNFDLAFEEIALDVGGIPAASSTRQIITVVCNSSFERQTDLLVAVDHLIEDLQVPAILATLDTRDQQYVWEERARDAEVFLMVPIESDDNMVNLMDDGLVHHMLSGPHDLADSYQPLIDMAITHLQNNDTLGPDGGPYEDARIALVRATDDRFLDDLGVDFRDRVRWNGNKTAAENEPNAFVSVGARSEPAQNDQSAVADALLALNPHIVVGATDDEMTASVDGTFKSIIELIEERWDNDVARQSQPRPLYILSPFNYGGARNTIFSKFNNAEHEYLRQRMLGIAWPATLDLPAYQQYRQAYLEKYPGGVNYNRENIYDAAYFLAYGMVAAGPSIRGETIASGMVRLTSGTNEYNVGKADLANGFAVLSTSLSTDIDLIGSNGKPDWDAGGGRHNPASVWCIDNASLYVGDVLTYDEQSQLLTGTVPASCFTFPAPP
jgi:hypothetical protein